MIVLVNVRRAKVNQCVLLDRQNIYRRKEEKKKIKNVISNKCSVEEDYATGSGEKYVGKKRNKAEEEEEEKFVAQKSFEVRITSAFCRLLLGRLYLGHWLRHVVASLDDYYSTRVFSISSMLV